MLDLIFAGGTLVDGSGAPAVCQDLGVAGDTIAAVGDLSTVPAARRIEARGLVVAPGFIDLHTHHNDEMDGGIEQIPDADNYLRQGVTTCVAGNCGGAAFPIGPHLDRVSRLQIRGNYAVLVGCNRARHAVLQEERPATAAELDRMTALVRQGFEEGAVGLSSGVAYTPFLTTAELIAMSRVAAEYGTFYASHIRNEGDGLLEAIAELIEVVRQSGAGGQISHLKCYGRDNWGKSGQALALIEAAQGEGLDVTADQYPYTGCFTGLAGALFGQETVIRAHRQGGVDRLLTGALRDQAEPTFARRYALLDQGQGIILAPLEPHPEFQGKTLAEYLGEQGGDPFEATVALCARGSLSAIYLAMCESDVVTYLKDSRVMVGSDGHLRVFGKSFSHPRNFGTFPRVLARYVREQGVLTLEQAIHKMTGMPARRLGLKRRGLLAAGKVADVTVFDPVRIQDHATFREGNAYATGIEWVLLAGQVALEHDRPAAVGYGRVLRRGEG
ncbi:MAG: amidohydrolase family protein [Candidatus Latescibacterota bacterium]|jgi:dihydroorotase/N-acyl-D-amino-acid deacylase